ncbi:MAG: acetoacetyl-CoA reductase [Myxococcales bacterium]
MHKPGFGIPAGVVIPGGGAANATDRETDRARAPARPDQRLTGRVALVAGCSRGIGRAVARALGDEGAALAVHFSRGAGDAESLAAEIDARGAQVRVFQADLARPEDCHRLLGRAARELGGVDILVNNPGIQRNRAVRKMDAADWDEVLATNLSSVFHLSKAALEPMIQRGWGRIINVASIVGQTGAVGQANYAAAEAGVIAFTKSLAQELARHGITVNAICPGPVEADPVSAIHPQAREATRAPLPPGRFGAADEVARLVRFLCTEGDWITGAQLNIDRGRSL